MGDIIFGSISLIIFTSIVIYLRYSFKHKGSICSSCKSCMASDLRDSSGKVDLLKYVEKMEKSH